MGGDGTSDRGEFSRRLIESKPVAAAMGGRIDRAGLGPLGDRVDAYALPLFGRVLETDGAVDQSACLHPVTTRERGVLGWTITVD